MKGSGGIPPFPSLDAHLERSREKAIADSPDRNTRKQPTNERKIDREAEQF